MKKNIFKFTSLLLVMLLISACSATKMRENQHDKSEGVVNYVNAYEDIQPDEILEAISLAEIAYSPKDASLMFSKSTDIALVTVNSIDGGSNVNELTGEYVYPYTYGKLTVNEVYKGNLTVDKEIQYVRMGGIISYQQYYNSLYPAQKQKHDSQPGIKPAYIKMMFDEDISVEAGKTYLVYMLNPNEGKVSKKDAYAIIGWQGGLREVQNSSNLRSALASEIKVYNNYTNSWETLESILSQ